jgi:hypothetical protein
MPNRILRNEKLFFENMNTYVDEESSKKDELSLGSCMYLAAAWMEWMLQALATKGQMPSKRVSYSHSCD